MYCMLPIYVLLKKEFPSPFNYIVTDGDNCSTTAHEFQHGSKQLFRLWVEPMFEVYNQA